MDDATSTKTRIGATAFSPPMNKSPKNDKDFAISGMVIAMIQPKKIAIIICHTNPRDLILVSADTGTVVIKNLFLLLEVNIAQFLTPSKHIVQ